MSHYDSDLCAFLVRDLYGELAGSIFEKLCTYGRADILIIQRLTRSTQRQVKHGLATLIQQNLVFWHESASRTGSIVTSYEPNFQAAYAILRTGKCVDLTANALGEIAGKVMVALLTLGHATVGKVIQFCQPKAHLTPEDLPTATTKTKISKQNPQENAAITVESNPDSELEEKLHDMIRKLIDANLILLVNESKFWSEADIQTELGKCVKDVEDYKAKSKKEKVARRTLDMKLMQEQWKYSTHEERSAILALRGHQDGSLKRKRDDSSSPKIQKKLKTMDGEFDVQESGTSQKSKKLKTTDRDAEPAESGTPEKAKKRKTIDRDIEAESVEDDEILTSGASVEDVSKNDLVIMFNHEKFAVLMRNMLLASSVKDSIGPATAKVYQTVLSLREAEIKTCIDAESDEDEDEDEDLEDISTVSLGPSVTTGEVLSAHADTSELQSALGAIDRKATTKDQKDHPKRHRRKPHEDSSEEGASDDEDHSGPVRQHLLLLSSHPDRFLEHIEASSRAPESWAINYKRLTQKLVLNYLFQTITNRFQTPSARLARICREKGRLDDRALGASSLLPQKELRARILALQTAGLLEQQEMPRDGSRLPPRTTFLYYFDQRKCSLKVVCECQKTILRCLQRLEVEREKISGLLEKTERSDVRGREDEILVAREKEALTSWKAKERQMWGEIGRIDDIVGVLRDF